jgi:hypothetical protein
MEYVFWIIYKRYFILFIFDRSTIFLLYEALNRFIFPHFWRIRMNRFDMNYSKLWFAFYFLADRSTVHDSNNTEWKEEEQKRNHHVANLNYNRRGRGNGRRIITSAGRVIAKSKCFKQIWRKGEDNITH